MQPGDQASDEETAVRRDGHPELPLDGDVERRRSADARASYRQPGGA